MFRRVQSATWSGFVRSMRIEPKTFGVRVFTRPPRISGAPDHSAIAVTGMPASWRCLAVPPVERISTWCAVSTFASSMTPVLSETETIARSIRIEDEIAASHELCRSDVAAGLAPDMVVEVHDVGDCPRVADRRDSECRGAIVELAR